MNFNEAGVTLTSLTRAAVCMQAKQAHNRTFEVNMKRHQHIVLEERPGETHAERHLLPVSLMHSISTRQSRCSIIISSTRSILLLTSRRNSHRTNKFFSPPHKNNLVSIVTHQASVGVFYSLTLGLVTRYKHLFRKVSRSTKADLFDDRSKLITFIYTL